MVAGIPPFLADFSLARPGISAGSEGQRIFHTGDSPTVSDSMDTVNKFLAVMAFATNADRTNAVALTVLLRNHWAGGKPIPAITATKSHAGKDTVIAFATNEAESTSISSQSTNWAFFLVEKPLEGCVVHPAPLLPSIRPICFIDPCVVDDDHRVDGCGLNQHVEILRCLPHFRARSPKSSTLS
jgi:hypothetical protein